MMKPEPVVGRCGSKADAYGIFETIASSTPSRGRKTAFSTSILGLRAALILLTDSRTATPSADLDGSVLFN